MTTTVVERFFQRNRVFLTCIIFLSQGIFVHHRIQRYIFLVGKWGWLVLLQFLVGYIVFFFKVLFATVTQWEFLETQERTSCCFGNPREIFHNAKRPALPLKKNRCLLWGT